MKLLASLLCIALLLSLSACSTPTETESPPLPNTKETTPEVPSDELPTEAKEYPTIFEHLKIIDDGTYITAEPTEDGLFLQSLFQGYPSSQLPGVFQIFELEEDAYEYEVYTSYCEGMTATKCLPTIVLPYHIVLLTVPDETMVPQIRKEIEEEADPKRFISSIAESVCIVSSGNKILLAMCPSDLARHLGEKFSEALPGAEMSMFYGLFQYEYLAQPEDENMDLVEPFEEGEFIETLHSGFYHIKMNPFLAIFKSPVDMFELYTTIPYEEGMEATVCTQHLENSPHQVVVLTVPEGSDAEGICKHIRENANPKQWIDFEAEKVAVEAVGNTILFVMSHADLADHIVAQFHKYMR